MLVERHNTKGTPTILFLCTQAKELYNRCNYFVRQAHFNKKQLPNISILNQKTEDLECYKNLHNTKTAKQTIRKVLTDWTNYKKAKNAYYKDPTKFLRKPKPPGYKKKLAQVTFYAETIRKKLLPLNQIVPTNDCFNILSTRKFKQVVITPKTFGFIIEVQYENTPDASKSSTLKKDNVCCIDFGLNNLCAITTNQLLRPILIEGRLVKSINQWFNKHPTKANSEKRYWRLENYFHHTSKWVIDYCLLHQIGTIIMGRSQGWKQHMNLGKKNNQNFQSVPFYLLQQKIAYKAALVGIKVVYTEEAYTSKASFYDKDPLPEYNKDVPPPKFSGKRKHRGLYVSGDGFALNSDVNGSMNIGRKVLEKANVIPEHLGVGNRSLVARPIAVNPLRKSVAKLLATDGLVA